MMEESNQPAQNTNITTATPSAPPSQITIHPDSNNQGISFISANKGLLIAVAVVLVVVIVGASAMIGMNSSKQYQGLIERVKQETQTLTTTP